MSAMDVSCCDSEKVPLNDKEKWTKRLEEFKLDSTIMNSLVMDYLVTEGYIEAAVKFKEEAEIDSKISLNKADYRIEIRDAILEGDMPHAITLINDAHPELLDDNRTLLFYLQMQQLIELIRKQKTDEALDFAQTNLSERGEESPECLADMEAALALLAFDNPENSPFSELLCPAQRHKVWNRVNTCILECENCRSVPNLTKIIKLLHWSEKKLDEKKIKYNKMTDIAKGEVSG